MTALKSPEAVAAEARRIAMRALNKATEAYDAARKNELSIQALELRYAEAHGGIAKELGDIRSILNDIVTLLTNQALAFKKAP